MAFMYWRNDQRQIPVFPGLTVRESKQRPYSIGLSHLTPYATTQSLYPGRVHLGFFEVFHLWPIS